MKKFFSILTLCAMICISACSDDEFTNNLTTDSGIIQCKITVPESFNTKGTPIDSVQNPLFNTLGLLTYHTEAPFATTTNPTSAFFPNVQVTKSGSNSWLFDKKYYWPQSGYLSFFSYAPYANSTNGITILNQQTGIPVLTYTIPHNVADQPDLMVAAQQLDLFKTEVPLAFSHALACVGFDVSGENVPIDSIGIRGVYTKGTLSLALNNGAPEWQNLEGSLTEFYKVGLIADAEATNPSTPVMATNGYLMMIPQALGDDAAIVIKFKGIDPKIIPLKNAGTTLWKAGEKYIYSLKEGTYTFDISTTNNPINYIGGNISMNIKSYYTTQSGLVKNLDWKAEIVSTNPTNAYWNNSFNLDTLNNNNVKKNFAITVAPYNTTSIIDNTLKQTDSIKYANIKDLSLVGNTYTTANTYVVNAPGWYKFPCWVMGNAISKSPYPPTINNTSCFQSGFKKYDGSLITDQSQLALNMTNAQPQLLWTDAPDLLSKVRLSQDKQYIEFYVCPETIRQGNGVIAIKNGNQIMWSWQIWVTDWVLNTKNQDSGNGNPNIMPFGVGRCSAATYNYIDRTIKIRFTQNESNLVKEIDIAQQASTIQYGENVSYYQWGRKDPMSACNGITPNSKTSFGTVPFQIATSGNPVSLNNGILNPNIFYNSTAYPSNWNEENVFSLWGNLNSETLPNIKTIYDPSPTGYRVPDMGFVFSLIKMQYDFVQSPIAGIKLAPNGTDYTIFLALTGGRGPLNGAILGAVPSQQQTAGYYWCNNNYYWDTTNPQGFKTYINLLFGANTINKLYYQAQPGASALSVCPIVE